MSIKPVSNVFAIRPIVDCLIPLALDQAVYHILKSECLPTKVRKISTLVGVIGLVFQMRRPVISRYSLVLYSLYKIALRIIRLRSTTPLKRLLENLLFADRTKDRLLIQKEVHTCLSYYQISIQTLEDHLRIYQCNTFLVANQQNAVPFSTIVDFQGQPKRYPLEIIIKRYGNDSNQQFDVHSSLYRENHSKLSETGVLKPMITFDPDGNAYFHPENC